MDGERRGSRKMVSSANSEVHEEQGADVPDQEKYEKSNDESKKNSLFVKVYTFRNSPLTDLMTENHIKAIHNMVVAALILMYCYAALFYLAAPDTFFSDIASLKWALGGLKKAFVIWTGMHVACLFIVYPATFCWSTLRIKFNAKVVDILFLTTWIVFLILMVAIPAQHMSAYRFPPITGSAIVLEQMRIFMKMYSFVREIVPKMIHQISEKGNRNPRFGYPSIKHFIYFLFVPCLLYRDSYPRTKSTRWGFVFSQIWQIPSCIFIMTFVFCRFFLDIRMNEVIMKWTLPEITIIFGKWLFLGSLIYFLVFYFFFHCWFNAFAEVLRFGDRMFYEDWWNSRTYPQLLRRWNRIVHDWLYAYIYSDVFKICGNKTPAMITVLLISAAGHEYIFFHNLGFFYPFISTNFFIIGVILSIITRDKKSESWNIIVWIMILYYVGLYGFFYHSEWYARKFCPRVVENTMDSFYPYIWSCGRKPE